MGVLYRANLFLVTGLELVEQTMQNIVNYHHGREYTKLVRGIRSTTISRNSPGGIERERLGSHGGGAAKK